MTRSARWLVLAACVALMPAALLPAQEESSEPKDSAETKPETAASEKPDGSASESADASETAKESETTKGSETAKESETAEESEPAAAQKKEPSAGEQPEASAAGNLKVTIDSEDENPLETWNRLLERRREIFERLQQLKEDFQAAQNSDGKRKIRDQYVELIREFEVQVYPEMVDLAETVYEKAPDQLEAGAIVMQEAFNENDYDRAAEIGLKLLDEGYTTKNALTMTGVAQFALHNFRKAHAILSEAEKRNRLKDRYASYVDSAKRYIDFWQREKKIREKEAALEGEQALPRVELETTKGTIVVELFEDHAPNTVANFVSLVQDDAYDGTRFHRVINGFMAQGGDPNTLDDDPSNDGFGGPGYTIESEGFTDDARMHFRGSLSMAHSGPDTGGSQFFITHLPTEWLNPKTEPERSGHTVFGRVVEGMDVAMSLRKGDRIKKATVLRKRPHEYEPEVHPVDEPEDGAGSSEDESDGGTSDERTGSSEEESEGANASESPE